MIQYLKANKYNFLQVVKKEDDDSDRRFMQKLVEDEELRNKQNKDTIEDLAGRIGLKHISTFAEYKH